MGAGNSGVAPRTDPGYDEPPRTGQSTNRMNTDYAEAPEVKQTRTQSFQQGASRG